MSKRSEAKQKQGYSPKPTPRQCSTCANFTSELIEQSGAFSTWHKEINLRCAIGGFAVKKTAVCDEYEAKQVDDTGESEN